MGERVTIALFVVDDLDSPYMTNCASVCHGSSENTNPALPWRVWRREREESTPRLSR
jgi:hypothetical protein